MSVGTPPENDAAIPPVAPNTTISTTTRRVGWHFRSCKALGHGWQAVRALHRAARYTLLGLVSQKPCTLLTLTRQEVPTAKLKGVWPPATSTFRDPYGYLANSITGGALPQTLSTIIIITKQTCPTNQEFLSLDHCQYDSYTIPVIEWPSPPTGFIAPAILCSRRLLLMSLMRRMSLMRSS